MIFSNVSTEDEINFCIFFPSIEITIVKLNTFLMPTDILAEYNHCCPQVV